MRSFTIRGLALPFVSRITAPTPQTGTPVTIHIHVDNADAVIQSAVDAGATVEMPPKDHFYGERSGCIRDPFGHRWSIGHHIEDVSADEMQRKVAKGEIELKKATNSMPRLARVGTEQAEQHADRGGLARAVGAEEAVHLPGGNLEVEAVERPGRAEGLRQAGGRDRGRGHDPDAT
jgi:hypothetical protein